MRKLFTQSIFFILLGIVIFFFYNFYPDNDPYKYDIAPHPDDITTSTDIFPYPISWNFYFAEIPGLNFGTVGAAYFKGKYYLNTWNQANVCFTLQGSGPQNEPLMSTLDSISSPPYVGAIRDMTIGTDGSGNEFLWGGKAADVLYKMDSNLNVKAEYTIAGGQFRAIAWDPNRKGFWNSNFTGDIICHDTLGNIKGIIPSTLSGKYGFAWDSLTTPDTALLWVWNQAGGTGNNTLNRINIVSGVLTASYSIDLYPTSVAGGANIFKFGNTYKLLLNFQSAGVVCYDLTNDSANNCTLAYYRNNLSKSIPDNNPGGVYDTLRIDNYRGTPGNLNIVLDTVYHSWVGDLTMILYHEGLADTLMLNPGNAFGSSFGSSGDNFIGTQIADDGTIRMDSITALMAPCTSPPKFRPGTKFGMDSLSKFLNTDINGDWVLFIRDGFGGDTGVLEAWHLCIEDLSTGITGYEQENKQFYLAQNYPNPFNPETTIEYHIPKPGTVSIKIYDITGREIAVLENSFKNTGTYKVIFDGSSLSSGIYFYTLQTENLTSVKKMILLK
ncbi:MAG: T9SS type A sorting domain-containing protein [Ignavibacteriae bacterium]|nr:T9SS type A sorting domain-containing protein [Ignavibacteriota bacterium]MCB9243947.1 T9SS type A sorting domain-containing protein [Ignavibacteriales bacterium]